MIEPLDTVYISKLTSASRRPAYHRPERPDAVFQVATYCGRMQLMDCDPMAETEAAVHHEPCRRCFPVAGRRRKILDLILVSGIPDA